MLFIQSVKSDAQASDFSIAYGGLQVLPFCLPGDTGQLQGLLLTVKIGRRVGLGYCQPLGGGQGCWEIFRNAQDSLPAARSINSTIKITL